MKKYLLLFFAILFTYMGLAQDNGMTYQAVIYAPEGEQLPGQDNMSAPLSNTLICLQFVIIDIADSVEYQEVVTTTTDRFGMVNLVIGTHRQNGGYVDSFNEILWDGTDKYLKIEIDVKGGCSQFEEISNQRFNYVPMALNARTAENVTGTVAIENGGTGSNTIIGAKTNLELELVNNTSDLDKPVSLATKQALDNKENTVNKSLDILNDGLSDTKYPSVKAVKDYVDLSSSTGSKGLTEEVLRATAAEKTIALNLEKEISRAMAVETTKENLSNKSINIITDAESDTKYPSVKSVKTYIDEITTAINTLADGRIYLGNASNEATEVTMSGDVTMSNLGVSTIGASKVVTGMIADGTILVGDLANNTVETAKIKDANVTTTKIADANITDAKLDKTNIPLSGFGAASADVALGANKLTGVANPTNDQDATTKKYVDDATTAINTLADGTIYLGDENGDAQEVSLSGDVTINNAGVSTIGASKVATGMIADFAVKTEKLHSASVTEEKINDFAVTTDKLRTDAVTEAKIKDAAVTNSKIQKSAITEEKINNFAVTTDKLRTDAVTEAKIKDAAVTNSKIQSDAVTGAKIKNFAVTTDKIKGSAVTYSKIQEVSSGILLGRTSVNTGIVEEIPTTGIGSAVLSNSPTFTGTPVLPAGTIATTQTVGNNSTAIATTAYVDIATDAINTLANGKIYLGDTNGAAQEVTLTGDVTIDNAGVTTIGASKVVTGMIAEANVTTTKIADANITNAKLDKTNIPLSGFAAAAADVALGDNKLTGVADPTNDQDAATKKYVDDATTAINTLADGKIYLGDASNEAAEVTMTGDVTIDNAGVSTIGASKVVTGMIADGTILVGDLANNAVETAKIKDANITNAKLDKTNIPLSGFGAANANVALGDNKLTGVKDPTLAQDAATKNYVDTATATNANLTGMVTSVGNATTVVTNANLTGDVTSSGNATTIGAGKVVTGMIADGTILVGDLANNAVETAKIKDANVTNAKLDKTNIPLSGFAKAEADVALGANKLTDVANPTLAQDAATKNYVDTNTGNNSSKIGAIIAATGLNSNGSYAPTTGANYISSASSVAQADSFLDTQMKLNTDGITTISTASNSLITEVNAIEAATGLNADGTYATISGTNYIGSASSVAQADTYLDAAIKANSDALSLKANIASPTFTGTPLAPTATAGTNTTQLATTAFVTASNATNANLTGDITSIGNITTIGASKVVTGMIADGTILVGDLANNAVETAKIKDANVTTAKIADANITTAKILDANVTNAKLDKTNIPLSGFGAAAADVALGDNKLTGVKDPTLAQDAATKNYVDTATATNANLTGMVTSVGNATTVVTNANLTGDVTSSGNATTIGASKVVTGMIADGTILVGDLANDAVETAKIKDANVTNAKLDKTNIPLSGFGAASADVALGANKLTGVKDPTLAQDAATKNYVDTATATNANLTGMVTSVGNATTVVTNANLTGDVTSSGNATTIGAGKVTNTMLAGGVDLTSKVTGILPIANGGTGSATQNFADLTTDQTIAGVKTFSSNVITNGTVTAGAVTYTATDGTDGQVLVTNGAGVTSWGSPAPSVREVADEISATASQTSFTLTQAPSANSKVKMYVNGIRISNTAYSISGATLTYVPANNGGYALTVSDRIQFDYFY